MKKKNVIAIILLVVIAMTLVTGCGKKEVTLESFVKDNPTEEAALAELTKDDPNAKIEFEGNIMRITYIVEDESITKEILDSAMEMMVDTFKGMARDLSTATEIKGIQIEIVYVDVDGKEITKKLFE